MLIKITLFITLVSYAFVISQSFFYVLAMSDATKKNAGACLYRNKEADRW